MEFTYLQPESIQQAVQSGKEAVIYAGGTDLLGLMKDGIEQPQKVINLKNLNGLDTIGYKSGEGLEIGPLVKISDLIESETIQKHCPLLIQTAQEIASPQLRNVGTVGGNICQRPRCWYFRGDFHCIRKGGDTCFAVGGENKYHCIIGGGPCFIVYPSDLAVALLALDAEIEITSKDGQQKVKADDFFILPEVDPTKENILKPGQIVSKILIPEQAKGLKTTYIKFKERAAWDFAIVSVAAILESDGNRIKKGRLAFGGVAPRPWMDIQINNKLSGLKTDDSSVNTFTSSLLTDAEPLEKNEYKVILARNLVKKAITELTV
jgi:xanthine dehydrogenase YagS FAD-binding subunit